MDLRGGVKGWVANRRKQKAEKIIKDFCEKFQNTSLIKTTQRPLSCSSADVQKWFLQIQNLEILEKLKKMIEEEYDLAKSKLEKIYKNAPNLNNNPQLKKLEKTKAEIIEKVELCYELGEKGAKFPKEKLKRLFELEEKYGNERTLKYLKEFNEELGRVEQGPMSLREREGVAIKRGGTGVRVNIRGTNSCLFLPGRAGGRGR